MNNGIITVIGKDKVGIIAKVCIFLSEAGINILDISQTIVQEYFNMMMIADIANSPKSFADISEALEAIGEEMGLKIKMQSEDIFQKMHRI